MLQNPRFDLPTRPQPDQWSERLLNSAGYPQILTERDTAAQMRLVEVRRAMRGVYSPQGDVYTLLADPGRGPAARPTLPPPEAEMRREAAVTAPLTSRALELHENTWDERVAAAQRLKMEASALQAEALAKLREAQELLSSASICHLPTREQQQAANALRQACDASAQHVHDTMPVAGGIAAFAHAAQRSETQPASTWQATDDGNDSDVYDFLDDTVRSWQVLS